MIVKKKLKEAKKKQKSIEIKEIKLSAKIAQNDINYKIKHAIEFLQSGKTKSLFHISTKKLQKKMDQGEMKNRYNDFYAQWLKSHPYAA